MDFCSFVKMSFFPRLEKHVRDRYTKALSFFFSHIFKESLFINLSFSNIQRKFYLVLKTRSISYFL